MTEEGKLNLLNEELDEDSQKYIMEQLNNWKESLTAQLTSQIEEAKQEKIEELEQENIAYREELKEEFTEKMLNGLDELKESIRAEVTAEVIRNNPELKILEQVKELVAPLLSEDYHDNTYEDTIFKLSEENEQLKRELELKEGAETLAQLLNGYSPRVKNIVVPLIKEGNPEEVTEQFYTLIDTLQGVFEAESEKPEDDSSTEDSSTEDSSTEDSSTEDSSTEDSSTEDSSTEENVKESFNDDSYITEGYDGNDFGKEPKYNSTRSILEEYANI